MVVSGGRPGKGGSISVTFPHRRGLGSEDPWGRNPREGLQFDSELPVYKHGHSSSLVGCFWSGKRATAPSPSTQNWLCRSFPPTVLGRTALASFLKKIK